MRTDLAVGHSILRDPVVVGAGIAFYGPEAKLAAPADVRTLVRRGPDSRLRPPTVVLAQPLAPPIEVKVARFDVRDVRKRDPWRKLRRPFVLFPRVEETARPITVRLAQQSRRPGRARLRRPVVLNAAPLAAPIRVSLARIAPRRRPVYAIHPPTVVAAAAAAVYYGPKVKLTYSRRGRPKSVLRRPILPPLARPVDITLARIRPAATRPRISPPTVVGAGIVYRAVLVRLAASSRGKPKSTLRAPTVVAAAAVYYGPKVKLAYSRRGLPKSVLRPAIIPPLARPVAVRLAASFRGVAKSALRPPTVVASSAVYGGPTVKLAPSRRGKTRSLLGAPIIPPLAAPVVVRLTRTRPVTTHPRLAPPAVVGAGVVYRAIVVRLAPSTRGEPKSKLAAPAVVGAGIVYAPLYVKLATSSRGRTRSFFVAVPARPPIAQPVEVKLAYSRRGVAKSALRPPIIPPTARPVETEIAVQLAKAERPTTKSRLSPPAVVGDGIVYRAVQVKLSPSSRGKPSSVLRPPAVVGDGVYFYPVKVKLAPSSRGRQLSFLRPPLPVPVARPIQVTLTRGRPGKTTSRLAPPVLPPLAPPVAEEIVTRFADAELRPRRTHSRLSPPAVVGAGIVYRALLVKLAPSTDIPLRRRPDSTLRRPVVVNPAITTFYGPIVTLAPSRRLVAKPKLRPPAVVGAGVYFRPVKVKLTQPRHPSRLAHPKLRPPAVVGAGRVNRPVKVTLAASKRGKPRSRLSPPAVVGRAAAQPITVSLAPQTRGSTMSRLAPPPILPPVPRPVETELSVQLVRAQRPAEAVHSRLSPPTVVIYAFRPVAVKVTRLDLRRRGPHSKLRPPAVVGAGRVNRPIRVVLVAVKTENAVRHLFSRYRLRPPTVVNPPRPTRRAGIGGSGFPRDWIEKRLAMLGLPEDLSEEEVEELIMLGLLGMLER